jgi:bifunctional DNA-binding transcriptional regulator/antitoxin component of YhaV-PrlF toxin-antitoxin module
MVLKTKTRAQGGSVVATLPAEVARRLAIEPGQMLYWRESGPGTYTVSALDPAQAAALEAMETVIDQYRDVFAALAK